MMAETGTAVTSEQVVKGAPELLPLPPQECLSCQSWVLGEVGEVIVDSSCTGSGDFGPVV